jgi:cytoskeleton protein RodZ
VGMTDVVVRRRRGLMAGVAALAGGLAAAYGWAYGVDHDRTALVVAAVLATICLGHLHAWRMAAKPLFVADSTGIRLRLGGHWTGVGWEAIERIEVADRGVVRDGQVVIVPRRGLGVLDDARLRTRLGAAINRQLYEETLVAPFGLTTTVSVVDVAHSLDRLSAGRVPVLMVDDPGDVPEPTVEITSPAARPAADATPVVPVVASEPSELQPSPRRVRLGALAARSIDPGKPQRRLVATVTPAARREEVMIAPHSHPETLGGLALSPAAEPADAAALPELRELRRQRGFDDDRDPSLGNVSLIIDATTDLSARAMEKVRRTTAPQPPRPAPGRTDDPSMAVGPVIGGELVVARRRLDLDIDELAERTRIRPSVIEAIEADDFGPCGGDFYARGHLRMLARVLALDPGPILEAYDAHFATTPVNPREVFEVELATGRGGLLRGGERSSSWGALVAAVLALVLVWGVARYLTAGSGDTDSITPPTTSDRGLGSPGPGNPPVHGPRIAHVKVAAVGGDSRVVVRDRFKRTVFSGVISDGDGKKLEGEAPLRVMAEDGGVVTLSVKGRSLGLMGDPGVPTRDRVGAGIPDAASSGEVGPESGSVSTTE